MVLPPVESQLDIIPLIPASLPLPSLTVAEDVVSPVGRLSDDFVKSFAINDAP
jgi:hypothetical protein